ncbi:MAG: MerR family transcriptional regulator [Gammaproteobacteria bacterium]
MIPSRSYSIAELTAATGFDRRTIVYYIQSGLLPKVGRRGPHTRYPEECLTRLEFIRGVRNLQTGGQLLTATLAEIRRALDLCDIARVRDLLSRNLPVDVVKALFQEPEPEPEPVPEPVPVQAPEPRAGVEATVAPATTGSAPVTTGVRGPSGAHRSYGLADAGIRRRMPSDPTADKPAEEHEETHPGLAALNPGAFQTPEQKFPRPADSADPPIGPESRSVGGALTNQSTDQVSDLGHLLRELELRPTMNTRRNAPGAPEQWTEIPITTRVYLSVRGLSAEDAPLAEEVGRWLKRALRARPAAG